MDYRLQSVTIPLGASTGFQLLPADTNRKLVRFSLLLAGAADTTWWWGGVGDGLDWSISISFPLLLLYKDCMGFFTEALYFSSSNWLGSGVITSVSFDSDFNCLFPWC
jgi:hypothetical protein